MKNWVYGQTLKTWRHRPLFKVAINTFLRLVQRPFTNMPFLLATKCEACDAVPPFRVIGYKFMRVSIERRGQL